MDEAERYRSSFIFQQEYFLYQHYLSRMIMYSLDDVVKIPVISAIFSLPPPSLTSRLLLFKWLKYGF